MVATATDRSCAAESATILVVEDDRAVRLLFTAVLEGAGYTVLASESGAAGLDAALGSMNRIRAVLTDAKMPGMSGLELLRRIRDLRPGLPAIVISGNNDESAAAAAAPQPTIFLVKPVSPAALTAELRRLLCDTM